MHFTMQGVMTRNYRGNFLQERELKYFSEAYLCETLHL